MQLTKQSCNTICLVAVLCVLKAPEQLLKGSLGKTVCKVKNRTIGVFTVNCAQNNNSSSQLQKPGLQLAVQRPLKLNGDTAS